MSWYFVGDKDGKEPLPGIPLVCSDEEFEAATGAYEAHFGTEAKGSVKKTGLYKHMKDAPAAAGEEA